MLPLARARQSVLEHPQRAEAHVQLGASLAQNGDLEGAVRSYKQALALDPKSHQAWNNLGLIFASLADRTTALTFFREALRLSPGSAEVHNNLANLHLAEGDWAGALAAYREAIALRPEDAVYRNHYGTALRHAGRGDEAEAQMREALRLDPSYAEAHANLGSLLVERGELQAAETLYRQAIAHKPDLAAAHVYLAMLLLRDGSFQEGWREQEWRWQWKEFPSPRRTFPQPQWQGGPLAGRRILLHAEQGLGDAIQFMRYAPMVAALGATVILEVHPELERLAKTVPGVAQVVARGAATPAFDLHCPLLSLPLAFSTESTTIPANIPYVFPERLSSIAPPSKKTGLHVGLVWAGDPKSPIDRRRSLSAPALAPLLAIRDVAVYSLQRGAASEAALTMPFAGALAQTGDFADTAAVISNLDLVIAVDTAVAHLSGALGVPVWILLPKVADWRWLKDREDSPWYPSARLFRQQTAGDWGPVLASVAGELKCLQESMPPRGKEENA